MLWGPSLRFLGEMGMNTLMLQEFLIGCIGRVLIIVWFLCHTMACHQYTDNGNDENDEEAFRFHIVSLRNVTPLLFIAYILVITVCDDGTTLEE